jgi:hypothetical protein
MYNLKNDRYRRARGGKAFIVEIGCAACGFLVLVYQKDGDGQLKRCYLNRILAPADLERLQHNPQMQSPGVVPQLICRNCRVVIGSAIRHHDGRIAFRLRQGYFTKQRVTS